MNKCLTFVAIISIHFWNAQAQSFHTPAPEIVSAWKHNTENLVVIFRHDGVFYVVDGDGGENGQPGMERGTFVWNKASGAFSANVVVDTNGNAGLSDPNGVTSITILGNTLTYSVTGEGDYLFTRIVNTPSAIVGSWYIPGQDANLTFLADGTYYHSQESYNEPDSTTGMERGTYTWNSGTGAFSGDPITDTNGDIGLSDPSPNPSSVFISGNVMTLNDGEETYTARRITPILAPLNTGNDFEVDKFANYRQTSASAPSLSAGPPNDDLPFSGEAYIEDTVSGSAGTMTITGQSPQNFVNDAGWFIETEYTSQPALDAASAFPNGADYVFSRGGGMATLSFPANGVFPPAPAVVGGNGNGTWSNGEFILGENHTLIWSPHTGYDPATLVTVMSVVDQGTGDELFYEEVIQGDIASFDFRGKLIPGRSYDVQLEHVKIASSTTSGTGPFTGKLGYALYNSSTLFTMVAPATAVPPTPTFQTPAPEIVSAWKHNSEDVVVIFRHDGVFYIVDGDGGATGQPGMERGTFIWDKANGAFSANVVVDTNGNAGLSDPNGATSITITGNNLTYNVTGEGNYFFTRIVNTPSAIVGSWHFPGEDVNLTFLADGTYYHSEESDNEPDSTSGMERGTYTWNSGTGAFSATPLTDTNGDIGLSDLAPSPVFTISGNVMTIMEGTDTSTLRRITPILAPLNTENDFEVDKLANYQQTSAAVPALLAVPVPIDEDHPFRGEAYIEDTVTGTGGTLTIGGQTPRDFVYDDGWNIEKDYTSLSSLNAASAFPNGANYVFSRGGGTATLNYPADGAFPPAPAIVGGGGNGTWSNGVYVLGENQTLIWSAHTAYDPATLVTVLSVIDKESGEQLFNESIIQGDIASFDFRGKLTQGKSYEVLLEHVKIAHSTTSGTGPFTGKLGYALYNSNTCFTMVVPEVQYLFITNEKRFRQLSPSQFNEVDAAFDARVEGVGINNTFPASAISVRKPDNTSYALALDEDHWDVETSFPSFAAMRNIFPTGTYIFDIGEDSFSIPFSGTAFPNQPMITSSVGTWVNGKLQITATEAASAFTLSTNDSTGNGWHEIIIADASDSEILNVTSNTPESPSLNVVAQISGGMLSVGQSYEMEASFGNYVERIDVSGPSWAGSMTKGYEQLSIGTFLTIEVVPDPDGTTFTTWKSGFFTPAQLANPAISGDDADPDADGVKNLLEFLFGGQPFTTNSDMLPALTTAPISGGQNLLFTYRRKLSVVGVTQVIEHCDDLSSLWIPAIHGQNGVTIVTTAVPGDATREQVTVTIPSTTASRFVRLRASR